MNAQYLPLILFGVFLNAAAQLFLKKGMTEIGVFDFSFSSLPRTALAIMTNLPVLGGLFCYVVSVIVWLMVLSRVEVSYAYPLLSVGYIVTAIAGYYLFGEALTLTRVLGIFVIILGVYLVMR